MVKSKVLERSKAMMRSVWIKPLTFWGQMILLNR